MLENLILLLITALILAFVWLLYLRHVLSALVREFKIQEKNLLQDLQCRRDKLPYLLEASKGGVDETDLQRTIVDLRALFHSSMSVEEELRRDEELELLVNTFLLKTKTNNPIYLDAKKDFEASGLLITEQKKKRKELSVAFLDRGRRFPYNLAAVLFALKL